MLKKLQMWAKSGANAYVRALSPLLPSKVRANSTTVTKPTRKKAAKKPVKSTRQTSARRMPRVSVLFGWASLLVLLGTTVFWAYLGARINQGNADQLINAYLFESGQTFQSAFMPGQHSFLLKWPLFLLIKAFGYSPAAFLWATVGVTVFTVALFAWILHRIERRPAMFGLIALALSSVLLLVPTQPYPGGLLPVNMAMLTTRNLEYALYLLVLIAVIKARKWRSVWMGLAALGAVVLFASDRLFVVLSLGGAVMALLAQLALRRWSVVRYMVRWLGISVLGMIMAGGIIWALNAKHVTHFVGQEASGPYQIAHGVRELLLGIIYALSSLFTNLGANPAFDATVLKDIPGRALDRLTSPAGLAYVVNAGILLIGLIAATRLFVVNVFRPGKKQEPQDDRTKLTVMLLWSTLAAFAAYIATSHEFSVDVRYLTVSLFAVFVSLAVFATRLNPSSKTLKLGAAIMLLAVASGVFGAASNYRQEKVVMDEYNSRNHAVTQALASRNVNLLVGDYWRVVPSKLDAKGMIDILPLSGCTTTRNILSSEAWQADLKKQSFAYLLSLDKSLTDYPQCTLPDAVSTYGEPSSTVVVRGTVEAPKEVILFYDNGARRAVTTNKRPDLLASLTPRHLEDIMMPPCLTGHTVMNIVAHEDDDLLFMNPDVMRNIKAGNCVRTVFLTAGDAGADNQFYWLGREKGSQAAYDTMDGPAKADWVNRTMKLGDHQYATIASPRNNPSISLIYLRLPDGNLHGQGFHNTGHESLSALSNGQIPVIHSVDGQSYFSDMELTSALTKLMDFYRPQEINTQADTDSHHFADHSDHIATGNYARRALGMYSVSNPLQLRNYVGYPVRDHASNISGDELLQKEAAFFSYARFDGAVCASSEQCAEIPTYGNYLRRSYQGNY